MLATDWMSPTAMTTSCLSVRIQLLVNEAIHFQLFLISLHLPLAPHACDLFLHNTFTLITSLSLHSPFIFSSFFLPPVYNWILFSGCYKCLCLLCLCLAPHFLPLLHRHPPLLSPPSRSPSFFRCVKPLLSVSPLLVLPTNCFISSHNLPFTFFILLFVIVN